MPRHEIDRVRRRELGRDDQIALVLPILVVDQNEHPAVARFFDQFLGARQVLRQFRVNERFTQGQVFHHVVSASRAT